MQSRTKEFLTIKIVVFLRLPQKGTGAKNIKRILFIPDLSAEAHLVRVGGHRAASVQSIRRFLGNFPVPAAA